MKLNAISRIRTTVLITSGLFFINQVYAWQQLYDHCPEYLFAEPFFNSPDFYVYQFDGTGAYGDHYFATKIIGSNAPLDMVTFFKKVEIYNDRNGPSIKCYYDVALKDNPNTPFSEQSIVIPTKDFMHVLKDVTANQGPTLSWEIHDNRNVDGTYSAECSYNVIECGFITTLNR